MPREIKFRAWHTSHNKMYDYVEHITYSDGSSGIGCLGYLDGRRMFSPDDSQVVLMQYTGLKDRKGNDIYEGDIVKGKDNSLSAVHYQGSGFDVKVDGIDFSLSSLASYVEVAGNIYEHHELLKQKG